MNPPPTHTTDSNAGQTMSRREHLQHIVDLAQQYDIHAEEIVAAMRHTTKQRPAQQTSGVLAKVLAYIGGVLVLAGIASFIGMQWDQINSATRVLITLGTGFAMFVFALVTLSDARFDKVTTPTFLMAAVLQPTGIVVMLNEYARGGQPEHGLLFMCVVMFLQQFLTFLATRRTVLLFASLFFGAAGFGTFCDILNIDFEIIALALGIALTAICYSIDKTPHQVITPPWYFAAAVFFLSGIFELIEHTPLEISFFGFAAAFMYLGTVVHSRTLLFVSVIALTGFTGYFFRDSLANAFGLIIMGVLLIGLSAFAMSLNRKFIRNAE